MYAATFTLDLYCENEPVDSGGKGMQYIDGKPSYDGIHLYGEFPHQYVDWDRGHAFRKARSDGWLINKDRGTCLCPKCSGKKAERKGK